MELCHSSVFGVGSLEVVPLGFTQIQFIRCFQTFGDA